MISFALILRPPLPLVFVVSTFQQPRSRIEDKLSKIEEKFRKGIKDSERGALGLEGRKEKQNVPLAHSRTQSTLKPSRWEAGEQAAAARDRSGGVLDGEAMRTQEGGRAKYNAAPPGPAGSFGMTASPMRAH